MNIRKEITEGKGLHWGDLEYGKKAETKERMMGCRGTGHFGTGFYVVSQDKYGDMHYDYDKQRPVYEIDLDAYKLFKPRNVNDAYKLHDALKIMNDFYVDSLINSSNYMDILEDKLTLLKKLWDVDDEDDIKIKDDYVEIMSEFINKYVKDEYEKQKINDFIDKSKNNSEDADDLFYELNDWINHFVDEYVENGRQYNRYRRSLYNAIWHLFDIFSDDKIDSLLRKAEERSNSSENTTSTEFMKLLGYEGVDVSNLQDESPLASPDNFTYGSVVYDLKPGTYKKIMDARKNESLQEYKNQKQTVVAYHGTSYPSGKFDSFHDYGINWFTQDLDLAKHYGGNILKCEITFNNPFYVGECMYYLSEIDEDEEYYDEKTNTLVPDCLCDMANRLGVEVSDLISMYSDKGYYGNDTVSFGDAYGYEDVNILEGMIYDITSEIEFGDLCKSKGYDCIIQEENGIITYGILNPDNIKILGTSFEEGLGTEMSNEYESSINESLKLNEVKRSQLINKTKNSDDYKDTSKGKNRYERRTKSRIATSVAQYNKVDMDALFKRDILTLGVDVHGETNDYVVTVRFVGLLKEVQREIKANNGKLEYKVIARAMSRVFNSGDVSLHCTCPDFCLKGDTNIKLLNGDVVSVIDLLERYNKGEELWVYATDEKGDFKPGKVNEVWISGYVNDMIKITLDNGKEIETTPNHRYMLRNGEYVEAKDLEVGSSLMPLYFRQTNGYENVKLNSKQQTQYHSVYKIVANECLQEEIENAKIRSGEDIINIHHSDFNKLNNYPSNLIPMGKLEHWNYHNTHLIESGNFDKFIEGGKKYWSTQEARDRQAEVMRETINDYYANVSKEEFDKIRETYYGDEWKKNISNGNKKVWENYSEEEYKARCQLNKENNAKCKEKRVLAVSESWKNLSDEDRKTRSKNISNGNKNTWREHPEKHLTEKFIQARKNAFKFVRDEEMIKKINISKIGNVLNKILDANEIPSPETYKKYKTNGYPNWTKSFNTWEELSNYYKINHKVVKIEYIHYDESIPVYDLNVDKYNNFYVDAGVILHNCYRQSYYASKQNYGTQYEPRPSNITNPNDTKGGGCKHCMLVLSNLDWMMKVSSVINNYIKYCQNNMEYNYANYIFPKVYGVPYKQAVQQSLFDNGGYLASDQKTVGDVAKRNLGDKDEKGKFIVGNKYRFNKKQNGELEDVDDNQLRFNFDSNEKELVPEEENQSVNGQNINKPNNQ